MPPDANEGELSLAKAQVVRNVRLARLARARPLLLQYQLRLHPFDNCLWTPTGTDAVLGLFEGGPQTTFKGKRLADGVEALIGAFYLAGAAAEAAQNTTAAAAAARGGRGAGVRDVQGQNQGHGPAAAAAAAVGVDSEVYGVDAPSVPALLDAASWVWHRVSQPGLEAAAALCEVLEVLPQGERVCGQKEGGRGVWRPPHPLGSVDGGERGCPAALCQVLEILLVACDCTVRLSSLKLMLSRLPSPPPPHTCRCA
jgi:hypothetical protein